MVPQDHCPRDAPVLPALQAHIAHKSSALDPLQLFQLRLYLSLSSEAIFFCKRLQIQFEAAFFPEWCSGCSLALQHPFLMRSIFSDTS